MKKGIAILIAALLALSASGCTSPFAAEYYYEEPFDNDFGALSGDATEVRNDSMLKTALTNLIIRHSEQAELRLSNYVGDPTEDLAKVCYEIKSSNPIGSYAVESLSYDLSYVVSYYVATIRISYLRSEEEIANVYYASSQTDFENHLVSAVQSFSPQLVSRVYSSNVSPDSISRIIRQCYYDDPVLFVTEPAVSVDMYPGTGANEIYDIRFEYSLSEQRIQSMSADMTLRLQSIVSGISGETDAERALAAAQKLSELCKEGRGDSSYAGTAFGALALHDADSKGYSLAYSAICKMLGIDCMVIEGGIGSLGGEVHYWNLLKLDNAYYHADVSAFDEDPFSAFLLKDEQLWGRYIWEAGNYPLCDGSLTYAEVAGIEEETVDTPETAVAGTDAEEPGTEANGETEPGTEEPSETVQPDPESTEEPQETN